MNLLGDLSEFINEHRPHGILNPDATEPTGNGYLLTVACSCGVVFERWVTPADADLIRWAALNLSPQSLDRARLGLAGDTDCRHAPRGRLDPLPIVSVALVPRADVPGSYGPAVHVLLAEESADARAVALAAGWWSKDVEPRAGAAGGRASPAAS